MGRRRSVRSHGSDIRGFEGGGSAIRWIRPANDTAVAVVSSKPAWLSIWTCGTATAWSFCSCAPTPADDRMKAPTTFFRRSVFRDEPGSRWKRTSAATGTCLTPMRCWGIKGYAPRTAWARNGSILIASAITVSRCRVILKDLIRHDHQQKRGRDGDALCLQPRPRQPMNPNPASGVIYCSNLCTEIAE